MDAYYDDTTFVFEENEDPCCNGCSKPIEDGSVVQFGDGIWHFECCHACHEAIKDEAIMTGDEAYHADCFRCVQCNIRIEDLVFTQTSKGIFCTACHELRKQMRQKRKEERLLLQQQQQQQQQQHANDSNSSSTLVRDPLYRIQLGLQRGDSLDSTTGRGIVANKERRGGISGNDSRLDSILNDKDQGTSKNVILSSRELSELNQMLNTGLTEDQSSPAATKAATNTTTSHENIPSPPRTRGSSSPSSDVTFQSLTDEIDAVELPASIDPSSATDEQTRIAQLERELRSTKSQLKEVDTKFNKIKAISRKALDEFHIVKEGYAAEVSARQNAEAIAAKLKAELLVYHQASIFGNGEAITITKKQVESLGQMKAALEQLCKELRIHRDELVFEMTNAAATRMSTDVVWEKNHQANQQQLRSVQGDIEAAKLGYARLVKARDDIINEMIMLNTKNAELTTLNNDLSRRVTEREREALAVMAGTSFLGDDSNNNTSNKSGSGAAASDGNANKQPQLHLQQQDSGLDLNNSVSLERKSSDHQNVRKIAQRDSISKAEPPKMFKFRRNKFGRRNNSNSKKNNTNNNSDKENDTTMTIGVPYDANVAGQPLGNAGPETLQQGSRQKTSNNNELIKELENTAARGRAGHNFAQTRFLRPCKCDVCNEKMWRVSELKCQAMFGNDLVAQVRSENGTVPKIVQKCIEAVETRGMDFEGIYRKSGAAGQMRLIQQAFENGDETCNLCDEDQWNDICAITSVLKQYFRDLPNPLFTHEMHSNFMDAAKPSSSTDQQFALYQKAIHSLPSENYNTLKYLMQHLDKVQQQSQENLMTTKNLAVVFGPTLMRNRDEGLDIVDMNHKINAIEYILSHFKTLFADPAPGQHNHSSPLPSASSRRNSLSVAARKHHRRELSTDDLLRQVPPAVPPKQNAGYI
ncbi:hypothetical protein BDB00DRAFT_875726 [Zychaea mexicana]|uniref:uncharacterized protein n=1 Tax=Zychaea mexicana TaxID=64656 RepID=UPI0022FE3359|nr:uncharacterized protein BDB00DRAFT_875726 [Zychaea mexicana]KAI9490027.1 hypothetical protein BDB00DRAFT_875726 [Zychaea mexicana]